MACGGRAFVVCSCCCCCCCCCGAFLRYCVCAWKLWNLWLLLMRGAQVDFRSELASRGRRKSTHPFCNHAFLHSRQESSPPPPSSPPSSSLEARRLHANQLINYKAERRERTKKKKKKLARTRSQIGFRLEFVAILLFFSTNDRRRQALVLQFTMA